MIVIATSVDVAVNYFIAIETKEYMFVLVFAVRCYASAVYVVMRCLSVCPSVFLSRSRNLSKRVIVGYP